ncbi:hypothetical protein H0H87_007171 [Tephrocybe sp. NHM501043]|nr:hypothetical protein H0H87_007171 [Tephrocybe sp. NHM501043]
MVFGINLNGPELKKPFSPPTVTLKEIHDAVPKQLLKKDPIRAAAYVARDITFTLLLFKLASLIGPWEETNFSGYVTSGWNKALVRSALWGAYYWVQGMKATASMERDENYVPYTRSEYNLPEEKKATKFDYAEVFEETPIYTLLRMFIMQGFGWWVYLAKNTMGSKMYPPGTNHFSPSSPLFKPEQRNSIIISNIALTAMSALMIYAGRNLVLKYYLVPYLLTNHWKAEWSFLRGAAATVDRPLLGWCGRFFFHNISHDHVAHHFFIKAPFYNGPQITKAIRTVLKDDYNYDSTPTFYALYRSFTQCLFIEEEGDIIFYKNKQGLAAREVAQSAVKEIQEKGWDPIAQDTNIAFPKLD